MARMLIAIVLVDGTTFGFNDEYAAHSATYLDLPDDQVDEVLDTLKESMQSGLRANKNLRLDEFSSDFGPETEEELIEVVRNALS